MAKQIVVITLLFLACSGCAFSRMEIDNNPPFSFHHFSYEDLDVTWQAHRTGDDITISGTVRNDRSYYLQDLELSARLVNEQGKVIARGTSASFPDYLAPAKPAPFHLDFHLSPGAQVKRVHFSYIYWISAGEPTFRVYEDVPRSGTFASPL